MKRFRKTILNLNQLESRETPATLVSSTTLTYQDADGDNATVTFSKPVLTVGNAGTIFTFAAGNAAGGNGSPQQLNEIDLTSLGTAATGLNITTKATRSAVTGGDGFAAIGIIDGTGIDLGKVTIDGDLAKIIAGDATTTTSGLKGLSAESLGRALFASGAVFPDLHSVIQGPLDSLKIKRDIFGADIDVQGGTDGKIGSILIGGSLIGLDTVNSGRIQSGGDIGPVKIGGNIEGGSQASSGSLLSNGKLGPVMIGGSLVGGSGLGSGIFSVLDMGAVTVKGDLQGGSGASSASILTQGRLAGLTVGGSVIGGTGGSSGQVIAVSDLGAVKVLGSIIGNSGGGTGAIGTGGNFASIRVGGSLVGGTGNTSGLVLATGTLGAVTIGGNVVGGSASGTADLVDSGHIKGVKRIGSVTIGGSLIAGRNSTSGLFKNNGAITAGDDIGSILIKGSLVGNSSNFALITARGQALPTATADVAIGKVTVLGRVEFANILAGFDSNLVPVNADAQIGAVTVGGDFSVSSIAAGAVTTTNPFFGDADDAKMSGAGVKDVAGISSRIASVTIKGQAVGAGGIPGLHFGIVAEEVGLIKAGGSILATSAGNSNDDFFVGITGDFKVNEI